MKKSLLPFLAALALILGVVAYYQWRAARDTAGALASVTADREKLRGRVAAMEKRTQELQEEAATLREQAHAASAAPGPNGSRTAAVRTGGPGGMPPMMQAMESPEMRRLMAVGQRGQLDTRYAALFKALGLAPEQLDQFKKLLIDKQNAAMDVMAAARSQGLTGPESRGQVMALVQQSTNELNDSIKSVLGDAAYQQYQQYDRTQAQRNVVDQLATRLSYTNAPLTPQQSDQLVQLLASTAPASTATGAPGGAPRVFYSASVSTVTPAGGSTAIGGVGPGPMFSIAGGSAGSPITSDTITQAQNVLNPTQLQALQQLQAEQQAQQQMGQLMRQSMESQGGNFRVSSPGANTPSTTAPTPPPGG